MTKKTKKKLKRVAVWYLGPAAFMLGILFLAFSVSVAAVASYMAYRTIMTINDEHALISNSLTGNCQAALEQQGFTVEKKAPEPEPEEDPEEDPEEEPAK